MRSLFCIEGDPRVQLPAWSAIKKKYIDEVDSATSS